MPMTKEKYETNKVDGKYYEYKLKGEPGFLITYEVVTEESSENGEADEHGFEGYHSCQPDEYDIEDEKTAVDLAVKYLEDKCIEPSSSHFSTGTWYMDVDADTDYSSGDGTRYSYHPYNWTPEQEKQIFDAMKRNR